MKIYTTTSRKNNDAIYRQDKFTGQIDVLGEAKNYRREKRCLLVSVDWYVSPKTIKKDDLILTPTLGSRHDFIYQKEYSATDSVLSSGEKKMTPAGFMRILAAKNQPVTVFVESEEYDEYVMYMDAAKILNELYTYYPAYENIALFEDDGKVITKSLGELILSMPADLSSAYMMSLSHSGHSTRMIAVKNIAERVLKDVKVNNGRDLMTQEQQIESFIEFSKLRADKAVELVTDDDIKEIEESTVYSQALSKLNENGFKVSKTQQFNVLQAVGMFSQDSLKNRVIYNMSDMGAGKTLMTVQAIYMLDLAYAKTASIVDSDLANGINLPNKNLIAPTLSVESSWIQTFKLFYDVKKLGDNKYELTLTDDGKKYISYVNVSSFTARSSSLTITDPLPKSIVRDYLIIDEIHQLLDRNISRGRFFENVAPITVEYNTFILSGTLSNLTSDQWYRFLQFTELKLDDHDVDDLSPKRAKEVAASRMTDNRIELEKSATNIQEDQQRVIDPVVINLGPDDVDDTKTAKEKVFHAKYSANVVDPYVNQDEEAPYVLTNSDTRLIHNESLASAPNFELFYKLVGDRAITAQSTTIAEELFGDQKKQHKAEVINVSSELDAEDISLLKSLHNITKDYRIYKSQAIANAINNAILNLNDGLANKNVYDVVNHYAESNSRFLSYLASQNVGMLKRLKESNLVKMPKLEETEKFHVLQDIIAKEPDETYLIVVNDYQSMTKLAKTLNVKTITRSQLAHPLDYQEILDGLFEDQNIVIVPQAMIKSSLDLVQANRLIQYQLNTEISDIIQTQNRINRIGQTRETKAFYIATDILQKNIIDLFLETYKNIRVAHKGIVELFVDISSQVNVVNDYISKAMRSIGEEEETQEEFHFDENGQMELFPMEPVEITIDDSPEEEEEEVEDENVYHYESDSSSISLFSPADSAIAHQLTPII